MQVSSSFEENGLTPKEFRVICHVICAEAENGECSSSFSEMAKITRISPDKIPPLTISLRKKGFLFHIKPGIFRSRFYRKPPIDGLDEWQKDFVKRGLADGTFTTEAEAIHAFLHAPLTSIRVTDGEVKFQLPDKPKNVIRPDFTASQQQTA
jgi:hypothetical protein